MVYASHMDATPHRCHHSDGRDYILAESEAELAAGFVVSGDEIMRELRESVARMEGG